MSESILFKPLCQKEISNPAEPRQSTYCMLEAGHEGKCEPQYKKGEPPNELSGSSHK